MLRPVVLCIKYAICLARLLPPFFEPAQTQNSARLNLSNSSPLSGNRATIGFGLISNFFVAQMSQDLIFAAVHSDGSNIANRFYTI